MRRLGAAAVLAALAVGCGGSGGGGDGAGPVRGTRTLTWWQDDGTTIVRPIVPAATAVSVLLLEAGGYREIPGVVAPDGSFTVPYEGTDSYFLKLLVPGVAPRLIQLTAHEVDLGSDGTGRPDAVVAASSTPLAFDLTGLSPWTVDDQLTLSSAGPRLERAHSGATPTPGTTAGRFFFNLQNLRLPAAGDLGWLVQSSLATSTGGMPYRRVVRQATLVAAQDLSDGAVVTLGPVPLTAPPTAPIRLDLRLSEFAARVPPSGGGVTPRFTSAGVVVRAYPRAVNTVPSIVLLSAGPLAGSADADLGTFEVPRFLPPWFVEHRVAESTCFFDLEAALGAPATSVGFIANRTEPLAGAGPVVRPGVGGVRATRVAGLDATQVQQGVGLTPTLSWTPPAVGVPNRYAVSILDRRSTGLTTRFSAQVSGTSVTVPAGLLEAGGVYVAFISSIVEPGFDERRPTRVTYPREIFTIVTATFAP